MIIYTPVKLSAGRNPVQDRGISVLAVDDEEFNLEILVKHLSKAGFDTVTAEDGERAWEYLQSHPKDVDILLLDRMMPNMDGLELLKRIKAHPQLKHLSVIMQTAAVGSQELVKCIEAGAYYYLTKPYTAEVLLTIVNAAARDYQQQNYQLIEELYKKEQVVAAVTRDATFDIRTIEEGRMLAAFLASFLPDPSKYVLGIAALFINAIEHGNLGIGYETKTELMNNGTWEQEIINRLQLPENQNKRAEIHLSKTGEALTLVIKDHGKGFRWQPFKDFDPSRITDPNGRGIAMAHIMPGATVEYLGNGNEVKLTLAIPGAK